MRLRYLRRLALTGLVLLAPGCMTGPLNGTTTDDPVQGKTFVFQGYHNRPSTPVQLQVLKDASADPFLEANWVVFANAVTSSTASHYNSPDPLYAWSVNGTPVTTNPATAPRWPTGGVMRVRALALDTDGAKVLTTFDDVTFSACLGEHAGEAWSDVGAACEGMGRTQAAVVSTLLNPVDSATPPDFLGRKGDGSIAETNLYYAKIQAPATLNAFLTKYGFGAPDLTATYYNDGDLGLGREMHCRYFTTPSGETGAACYVKNYAARDNGKVVFGGDSNVALQDAVARTNSFATVAMVYQPPANNPNSVQFIVYDALGARTPEAVLDNTGRHKTVPNNCLSCHGVNATYDASTHTVSGASFLPFDVFSFRYSSATGFTSAAQASALRQLNNLVKRTEPAKGVDDFIQGMYAPLQVANPTAVAKDTYVPVGWTGNGKKDVGLYNGVVKQYCRTCHMSASSPSLDFLEADDFTVHKATINAEVCGTTKVMPQAEHVMKKFWDSGARAYLVTGLGLRTACKP
ncbi:hypothetical protein OV207_22600 [Corallococcus sp. BB11-1]|uniref:hypothetical protein n=1 Tax=Corallococcus sp. BB11-1 TaxID=2996783 RepID=UPI00226E303D|nr:hypothetical protein [Corallococcus sp. BB11-1]MCY1034263.1 hypothetical protein [Corallococcus sp. BB11-1]